MPEDPLPDELLPDDSDRFARFRAAVLAEPELEHRLRAVDDWDAFTAAAVAAATERGIELTREELEAVRRQEQLRWLARWA
jgi:hypothetical protein